MYIKDAPVSLKASASSLCNNLAIWPSREKESITYAVVHKAFVCLSNVTKGGIPTQKQVSCKGEGAHSSSSVLQAKWCVLPERNVLVIASVKGVQVSETTLAFFDSCGSWLSGLKMFDPDGSIMIFWQSLPPCETTEVYSQFSRGICAVGEKHICVGSSDGGIMVFDVPSRGTGVKLQETLSSHSGAICDLVSKDGKMVSVDDTGLMIIWQSGGHFTQVSQIKGFGFPCSSVALLNDLVIGGYGTGHIRLFNQSTGKLLIEVCAHARWINALDVAPDAGMLLSVSEDSFVRVWQISGDDRPKIEMKFQQTVSDTQLCGGKFLDPQGACFGVTGYDLADIVIYSKK